MKKQITEVLIVYPVDPEENRPFCEFWRGNVKRTYPIDIDKYYKIRNLSIERFVTGNQYEDPDVGNAWHFFGQ